MAGDDRAEAAALRVVPKGRDLPGKGRLRALIEAAIREEVSAALRRQADELYPDVKAERERLAAEKARQDAWGRTLAARHAELDGRSKALNGMATALRGYFDWIDGSGEVDQLKARWKALVEAYHVYAKVTHGR